MLPCVRRWEAPEGDKDDGNRLYLHTEVDDLAQPRKATMENAPVAAFGAMTADRYEQVRGSTGLLRWCFRGGGVGGRDGCLRRCAPPHPVVLLLTSASPGPKNPGNRTRACYSWPCLQVLKPNENLPIRHVHEPPVGQKIETTLMMEPPANKVRLWTVCRWVGGSHVTDDGRVG